MKRLLACLALALIWCSACADPPVGSPRHSTAAIERLVAKSSRAWAQSAVERNVAKFRNFVADGYVQLYVQPATNTESAHWVVTTKNEWSESLRSGNRKYESVDLSNLKVYVDGDVATLTGEYTEKGSRNGVPYSDSGFYVETWKRRHGRWIAISSVFP